MASAAAKPRAGPRQPCPDQPRQSRRQAPRRLQPRTVRSADRCRGPSAGLPCAPKPLPARASPSPAAAARRCCRSAEVRATSSNPGNITPELCSRSMPTAPPTITPDTPVLAGREQDPAAAARKAQAEASGGAVHPVAGAAVVKLRSRAAVRARIVGRELPGAHTENPGDEGAQGDPAGEEVPPGGRMRDPGACLFRGIKVDPAVRSGVGKTHGPDRGSGYGEGLAGSPRSLCSPCF